MATYPYTISGSEYTRTPNGEEITVTYVVNELTGDAAGRMYEAATVSALPRWLQRHPTRPDLLAGDFRAQPARNQPNTAVVTVRYRSPELLDQGSVLGAVTVSMTTQVITEETTEDINGNTMSTSYISRVSAGLGGSSVSRTTQVHRASVERPTFAVQFTRVEDSLGFSKATTFAGKVNSVPWQGKPALHWLLRVSSAPSTLEDRFDVRYDAVYNPKSWRATFRHVVDGRLAPGFTPFNGETSYDVYEGIDYNQLGLPPETLMAEKITAPKSVGVVPLIQRGDAITANYLNTIATEVNALTLNGPKDLDTGVGENEATSVTLEESSRVSETVRITNPEDDAQYVDVARPTTVNMYRSDTGELWVLVFNN